MVEQYKKRQDQCTKRYQQSNYVNIKHWLYGYKAEFLKYKTDPTFDYYVANVDANGWLNIKDDDHLLYWVNDKSIFYDPVFNNKIQNQLIMYLQVRLVHVILVTIF